MMDPLPTLDPGDRPAVTVTLGRTPLASVSASSRGLLSIGVMVSAIILSSAMLVRIAVREGRRQPGAPLPPPGGSAPSPKLEDARHPHD